MPSRVIRLVLALLLALLVPLQGFAAVSAGICMASGHHDMAAEHSHDDGAAQEHVHDDGVAQEHSHDVPASDAHCTPCVACCAAAAIAPPVPVILADARADAVNAAAPSPLAGVQPALLDRPPLAL